MDAPFHHHGSTDYKNLNLCFRCAIALPVLRHPQLLLLPQFLSHRLLPSIKPSFTSSLANSSNHITPKTFIYSLYITIANLARTIQSLQSFSPTSPRPSAPTISPRSPEYPHAYLSSMRPPVSPMSSPLAQLEMEVSTRPLSKNHFEWCLACCKTALDREELASMAPSAADMHGMLQSLVDIYAEAELRASASSSSSFASFSPSPPSSPTRIPKLHSTLRLPVHKPSPSRPHQSSFNSSPVSHFSQSASCGSITTHLTPGGTTESQCTFYHPSSSCTSSISSFASSAHPAVTLALTLLRALSKEQLLDLIFLIYSKAPRNLAVAAPYWVEANHADIEGDGDEDSDTGCDYHKFSDNIDSDHETGTREIDAPAWSPNSLISCFSLSLPPWRQQAMESDKQLDAIVDSAGPFNSDAGSIKRLMSEKDKGSLTTPLRRRAEAAMLSAILVIPGSTMRTFTAPSGPQNSDEPVPPLPGSESSPVERLRKAKHNHNHGKNHDAQECCEPGSPPCYDYKSSYWQYQTRRRTRQRVKPKGTNIRSNQLPPPCHRDSPASYSSKASPENEATIAAIAIRERNEAIEQEKLQEASKLMNEVQIAVTSLDSRGRVSPAVLCGANNTSKGQDVHLWPTQRIYTICLTPTANGGLVNEGAKDDCGQDSSISPTFGIPISSSTQSARTTITSFTEANTPPRSSSLPNLSGDNRGLRISFQPSATSASILKFKNRAPPPLPIETTGLSVRSKDLATTVVSPSTVTPPSMTHGPAEANTLGSKSLAQKAAETSHKIWETSMTVLRRKVNSPSNAAKLGASVAPTSYTRTSMEIPSVIVSTPLSLPSYESAANASSNDPKSCAASVKLPRSQRLHTRSQDFSIEVKTRQQDRIPFHHHQFAISLPGRGGSSFLPSIAIADPNQETRFKPKGKKVAAPPSPLRGCPGDGYKSSAFMIPDDYMSMIPPSNSIPWSSPTPLSATDSFESNSSKSQPQPEPPLTPLPIVEAALESSISSLDRSALPIKVPGRKKSIHEKLFGHKRDKTLASAAPTTPPTALADFSRQHAKTAAHDHINAEPHTVNDAQVYGPQESPLQPTKCPSHNDSMISLASSTSLLTASNLSMLHPSSNRSSRVIEDYQGRPVLWSSTVSIVSSASTSSSLSGVKCPHHHHHRRTTTASHNPGFERHGGTPMQTGAGLGITAPLIDADRTMKWGEGSTISSFPQVGNSLTAGWTRPGDAAVEAVEMREDSGRVEDEKKRKEEEYVARVMGQWQSWAETCGTMTAPSSNSRAGDTSTSTATTPAPPATTRLVSRATRVLTRGNGANLTQRVKFGVH